MRILAIDTSSNTASAAITENGILLAERILNYKKTHSQKIMPMVSAVLDDLELNAGDIDVFAAAIGPGSFTGIRIGAATIKGLAHACKKPTVGVSSLEELAYNLPFCKSVIVPIIDARRNRVYTAAYRWDGNELTELYSPSVMDIESCVLRYEDYPSVVFVGDGVIPYREYFKSKLKASAYFAPVNVRFQRASSVAAIAERKAKRGETTDYAELVPFYINKSQAEQDYERKKAETEK